MASQPNVTIAIKADTSSVARTARIIAKHLTAMAEELEQPDALITFPGTLSADTVAKFQAHMAEAGDDTP